LAVAVGKNINKERQLVLYTMGIQGRVILRDMEAFQLVNLNRLFLCIINVHQSRGSGILILYTYYDEVMSKIQIDNVSEPSFQWFKGNNLLFYQL